MRAEITYIKTTKRSEKRGVADFIEIVIYTPKGHADIVQRLELEEYEALVQAILRDQDTRLLLP